LTKWNSQENTKFADSSVIQPSSDNLVIPQGIGTFVDTVVGKMGASLQRIQGLGVANIMVDNLVPMSCMPFTTLYVNGETGCTTNDLLDTETSLHDEKLQAKVNELNNGGANIVMLDLTKALRNVFENGPTYGKQSFVIARVS